jgi:hypothetical protein
MNEIESKPKYRTDKYFKIGTRTLHYIHYRSYHGELSYGWSIVPKESYVDLYFGKHVFVLIVMRNWYYT